MYTDLAEFREAIGEDNAKKLIDDISERVNYTDWDILDRYDLMSVNIGELLFNDDSVCIFIDDNCYIYLGVELFADTRDIDDYLKQVIECKKIVKEKMEPVIGKISGIQTIIHC